MSFTLISKLGASGASLAPKLPELVPVDKPASETVHKMFIDPVFNYTCDVLRSACQYRPHHDVEYNPLGHEYSMCGSCERGGLLHHKPIVELVSETGDERTFSCDMPGFVPSRYPGDFTVDLALGKNNKRWSKSDAVVDVSYVPTFQNNNMVGFNMPFAFTVKSAVVPDVIVAFFSKNYCLGCNAPNQTGMDSLVPQSDSSVSRFEVVRSKATSYPVINISEYLNIDDGVVLDTDKEKIGDEKTAGEITCWTAEVRPQLNVVQNLSIDCGVENIYFGRAPWCLFRAENAQEGDDAIKIFSIVTGLEAYVKFHPSLVGYVKFLCLGDTLRLFLIPNVYGFIEVKHYDYTVEAVDKLMPGCLCKCGGNDAIVVKWKQKSVHLVFVEGVEGDFPVNYVSHHRVITPGVKAKVSLSTQEMLKFDLRVQAGSTGVRIAKIVDWDGVVWPVKISDLPSVSGNDNRIGALKKIALQCNMYTRLYWGDSLVRYAEYFRYGDIIRTNYDKGIVVTTPDTNFETSYRCPLSVPDGLMRVQAMIHMFQKYDLTPRARLVIERRSPLFGDFSSLADFAYKRFIKETALTITKYPCVLDVLDAGDILSIDDGHIPHASIIDVYPDKAWDESALTNPMNGSLNQSRYAAHWNAELFL